MTNHPTRIHVPPKQPEATGATKNIHLAVIAPKYARAILAGTKTIESRLTITRRVPFGQVTAGERVYFLARRIDLLVTAIIGRVESHEALCPSAIEQIRRDHGSAIGADELYWVSKGQSRFATLIWLDQVEQVWYAPDDVHGRERSYRSAWFVRPGEQCVYPACLERPWRQTA